MVFNFWIFIVVIFFVFVKIYVDCSVGGAKINKSFFLNSNSTEKRKTLII